MSDVSNEATILNTIKDYFELDINDITTDQRNQLKKFLNSASNSVLIVERSEESVNQISVRFQESDERNANRYRSDSTLVFVKCGKTGDNSTTDEIINETETISRLRRLLHRCDGSASAIMYVLSELRRSAKTPQILEPLKSERKDLVSKVDEWAENLADISEIDVNSDIIDRISILKAKEGKLRAVIRVCDSLFSDIPSYSESKPTLEQIQRELSDESLRLFREWYQTSKDVKLDQRKQCIEIDTSSQVPKVTFDPKLVKVAADTGVLRFGSFLYLN